MLADPDDDKLVNYRDLDPDNDGMPNLKTTPSVTVVPPVVAHAETHPEQSYVEQSYVEQPIASAATGANDSSNSIAGTAYPDMTLAALLVFSLVYLTLIHIGTLRTLKSALLVFISTCLASGPTLADVQTGLYLGIGGGASRLMPGLANATIDDRDSYSSVWNAAAGYQLSRTIGVEFEYADLGTTVLDPIGFVDYQDINVSGLYHLGGVASAIGGKKFSLFGRLGVGTVRNQSNLELSRGSSAHWLAGAGVQVPVTSNLSFRAEGVTYDADASRVGVSVLYRTGRPSLPSLSSIAKRFGFGNTPDSATDAEETQLADATPSSDSEQSSSNDEQPLMNQQSEALTQSDKPAEPNAFVYEPAQYPMPGNEELGSNQQPSSPPPVLMSEDKASHETSETSVADAQPAVLTIAPTADDEVEQVAAADVDTLKMQRIEAASEAISDNSLLAAVQDDNGLLATVQDDNSLLAAMQDDNNLLAEVQDDNSLLAAAQEITAPTLGAALPVNEPVNQKATVPPDALQPVHFGFDDVSVSQESRNTLQPLIDYLLGNPEARVTLTGHTDNIGNAEYNQLLSERRARAVELFLLQQGIDKKMIRLLGMGEKRPVRSNDKPAGRKSNRRVSIVVD